MIYFYYLRHGLSAPTMLTALKAKRYANDTQATIFLAAIEQLRITLYASTKEFKPIT